PVHPRSRCARGRLRRVRGAATGPGGGDRADRPAQRKRQGALRRRLALAPRSRPEDFPAPRRRGAGSRLRPSHRVGGAGGMKAFSATVILSALVGCASCSPEFRECPAIEASLLEPLPERLSETGLFADMASETL